MRLDLRSSFLASAVVLAGLQGALARAQDADKAYVKQYVRLTLREGSDTAVERGDECWRKGTMKTVMCRAVTLTLTNSGPQDLEVGVSDGCSFRLISDISMQWDRGTQPFSSNHDDGPFRGHDCGMIHPPYQLVVTAHGKKDWPTYVGRVGIPRSVAAMYGVVGHWQLYACVDRGGAGGCDEKYLGDMVSNKVAIIQK